VPGGRTSPDASGGVLARRIVEVGASWGRAGSDTICGLIGSHALSHPHRTAVIDGALRIGYAPLLARADAIAGALSAQGVAPGSLVGVCVRRTWELVATLLGILRAGCAYVPLDPQYPRERVRYMLQHAHAAAAIVDDADSAALCAGAPRLLMLPQIGADAQPIAAGPSATDLAYVIYTSGSTGQPKGVAVEHGSVVALVHAMRALLRDDELEGVLAAASICFDPSVMEILGTLCLGGTVVLADNVLALPELPSSHAVRTAIMVPSSMQALLAAGWRAEGIRCVVLGGEVLAPSLVARLHALDPRLRVFNVYGPTEDTVYSTAAEIRHGASAITIGTPVPGSRAYILDASMHPAPVGMPGELYLAGGKLARGYLHDAQRTSQRFVDVPPNGPVPERRLYRTGDLCRRNADGQIEFIGRADHQIKLRGFRIELEDVASALASLPGVDAAAAAVVETAAGRKLLAGYVVTHDHTVPAAACAQLASRLPKYMVPQAVLRLDALPRLPNGKLDRAALPVPDLTRDPPDAPVALPTRSAEDEAPAPSGADPVAGAQSAQRSLHGTSRPDRHAALLGIVRNELAQVLGIADPAQRLKDYPHHLSGGMCQRAMIAMALTGKPELLIADEPTTALDVTTQAQILDLLRDLQRETGMAMVLVSHDLGLIAESCARVAVMYAGRIVEQGPTAEIFSTPRHPYTRGLLAALPRIEHVVARLATMPGVLPQPGQLPPGCSFAPRCDRATPACEAGVPRLEQHGARALRCLHPQDDPPARPRLVQVAAGAETLGEPMVAAQALGLRYAPRRLLGLFARGAAVQAVDGVSFTLHRGETLGLVGESGCGKSTVARMVAGLLTPSAGELRFAAERGAAPGVPAPRFAQLVFQDPLGALDPRQRIGAQIAEPMEIHGIGDATSRRAEVLRLLQAVGLDAVLAGAFPHRLSGGQRQRVVLARALALRPPMLIADEPFSALDVSVQAQVIEVLAELQAREALTLLFISHDLRVVRRICGRVAVMYAGRIVESAPAALLFATPQHPYTRALLAAVPTPEVGVRRLHQPLPGDPPSPLRPPTGCRFHPRCAQARPLCRVEAPALHELTPGQAVACHVVRGDA